MKKTKLLEVLEVVSKGLEKNKELPLYEHLCFTGSDVFSHNSLFTIKAPFKVKTPFAVHGNTFIDLLKASQSDDVAFSVEGTDLLVKAGKSNFELPIKLDNEFIWNEPIIEGIELDPVVASSIVYALQTCSPNEALEAFHRVCIKECDGYIFLFSTDGDALTRYNTGLKVADPIEVCLTREFSEIINNVTAQGVMKVGKEWVSVSTENFTVYGQNLGVSTLNYNEEINKLLGVDATDVIPKPLAFNKALERAMVVAIIETKYTDIVVADKEMSFITETPFGNVYDSLKTDHPDIDVKINAKLLLSKSDDSLAHFKFMSACTLMKSDKMLRLVANMY